MLFVALVSVTSQNIVLLLCSYYRCCVILKSLKSYERIKIKVALEQAMKAQRESIGIALLFL